MNIDRIVMAVAGIFIVISAFLGHYHHEYWLFFTAFVGVNLLQSAFTGFCPLASILKMVGTKPGQMFT